MAKPSVRIKGLRKLQKRVKRALRGNPQEIREKLVEAGSLVELSAKKNIRGSRTRAKRKGRNVTAPSNVLANDQGTLRLSIKFKVTMRKSKTKIRALVTIGPQRVRYGAIHEFGGTAGRGARIPARPYLGPALDTNESAIIKLLGQSFKLVR